MSLNDIVNVEMLAQPYNWIVVILMLTFASMTLCYILG